MPSVITLTQRMLLLLVIQHYDFTSASNIANHCDNEGRSGGDYNAVYQYETSAIPNGNEQP